MIRTEDVITPHDLVSINALVDYLAHLKGFQRENTYFLLEAEFKVPNVNHIQRNDFDRAIKFLVNLQDITTH